MNTDNIEYIKSGSMWFIKCNHEFIGGRYDSQQTAQLMRQKTLTYLTWTKSG